MYFHTDMFSKYGGCWVKQSLKKLWSKSSIQFLHC